MFALLYLSLMVLAASQPVQPLSPTAPPASDFVPLCDPANFSTSPPLRDLPFPDIPDQLSFTAELSVIDSNLTGILTYYYDGSGNCGRIDLRYTDWYMCMNIPSCKPLLLTTILEKSLMYLLVIVQSMPLLMIHRFSMIHLVLVYRMGPVILDLLLLRH